jgi:hypothetical protein
VLGRASGGGGDGGGGGALALATRGGVGSALLASCFLLLVLEVIKINASPNQVF